jgi:hypothetical protein
MSKIVTTDDKKYTSKPSQYTNFIKGKAKYAFEL